MRLFPTYLNFFFFFGGGIVLMFLFFVCLKLEFGAGDIRGPLFGMKVFRNVTARW